MDGVPTIDLTQEDSQSEIEDLFHSFGSSTDIEQTKTTDGVYTSEDKYIQNADDNNGIPNEPVHRDEMKSEKDSKVAEPSQERVSDSAVQRLIGLRTKMERKKTISPTKDMINSKYRMNEPPSFSFKKRQVDSLTVLNNTFDQHMLSKSKREIDNDANVEEVNIVKRQKAESQISTNIPSNTNEILPKRRKYSNDFDDDFEEPSSSQVSIPDWGLDVVTSIAKKSDKENQIKPNASSYPQRLVFPTDNKEHKLINNLQENANDDTKVDMKIIESLNDNIPDTDATFLEMKYEKNILKNDNSELEGTNESIEVIQDMIETSEPLIPINSSINPIIIDLSDDEEKYHDDDITNEPLTEKNQSDIEEIFEGDNKNNLEDTRISKPTVSLNILKANHEKLMQDIKSHELELRQKLNTLQSNSIILQKKLVKREDEVNAAEKKLNMFIKSSNSSGTPLRTSQIMLQENAAEQLEIARGKRNATKFKLDAVNLKYDDLTVKWDNFAKESNMKIQQSKLNYQYSARTLQTNSVIEDRRNLLMEKGRIHNSYKNGDIAEAKHTELIEEIDSKLTLTDLKTANDEKKNNRKSEKSLFFDKSLTSARNLLAENKSRTELTKNSLYEHLETLSRFKENFEDGNRCPTHKRDRCKESAEILFFNGVKMPIVNELLQDYGLVFRDAKMVGVDKRAQFFKSITIARELVGKSNRNTESKWQIYDSLSMLENLRKTIDIGIPPNNILKGHIGKAVVFLRDQGLKMEKLYTNLLVYGIPITRDAMQLRYPELLNMIPSVKATTDFKEAFMEQLQINQYDATDVSDWSKTDNAHNSQYGVLNIHAADEQEHIRELLENLKQDEMEIEGEALTPEGMTVNLLQHQRLGLQWLLGMEKSKKMGGLLADDMGLGKTVQGIALILAHKSTDDMCRTNLIVAPVSVLRVWEGELQTKIKENVNFKVFIYGGVSGMKLSTWKDISKYDAVLVSYNTLAIEYKKHWPTYISEATTKLLPPLPSVKAINSLKKQNEYWSPFFCDDSKFYRTLLDEGQNIKNKNTQAAKACCSVNSVYRWILSGTPIQNNMDELYSLIRYLRIAPYNREEKFNRDIGYAFSRNKKRMREVDSDDRIRAMKKVQVLLRAIMLRRTKNDKIDGKPILELPPKEVETNETSLVGTELEFYSALEAKNKKLAKQLLERKVQGNYSSVLTLLLRLRQACCHSELVVMGEKKAEDSKVVNGKNFEQDWLRLYRVVKGMNNEQHDNVINSMNLMTCFWCMEQLELESTSVLPGCGHLLCNSCIEHFIEMASANPNAIELAGGSVIVPCTDCNEMSNDKEIVPYKLYDQVVNQQFSEQQLYKEFTKEMEIQRYRTKESFLPDFSKLEISAKIIQCIEVIKKVFSESNTEKIIVFSQFTTFFLILDHFLKKELDISTLRYDGSMKPQERSNVINEFYKNDSKRIMLISMKAGNSGLTLTCANHVVIVDPFWNPYVEEQAQDRCHRISQTKKVQVHKLFIKNSVEDRIAELQKIKRDMVDSAMDPNKIREVNSLGTRELGFLFGLNSL